MTLVSKYNTFKGISTVLTVGTPMISLASCSELFVHRSDTSISAAGIFAILFAILFLKDNIVENFKIPSPFIISVCGLIVISLIESIIYPLKIVFITTVVVTGIDTLTFRRIYKNIERSLPENVSKYFKFGFIFGKTDEIVGE